MEQYTQQVKGQLRTFKELTSALLRRENKQVGRKTLSFNGNLLRVSLKFSADPPQGPSAPAPPSFPAAARDSVLPEFCSSALPKRSTPRLCSGDAACDELRLPNISERFCTVATSPGQIQGPNQSKAERRRLQLPPLLPAEEGWCDLITRSGDLLKPVAKKACSFVWIVQSFSRSERWEVERGAKQKTRL